MARWRAWLSRRWTGCRICTHLLHIYLRRRYPDQGHDARQVGGFPHVSRHVLLRSHARPECSVGGCLDTQVMHQGILRGSMVEGTDCKFVDAARTLSEPPW